MSPFESGLGPWNDKAGADLVGRLLGPFEFGEQNVNIAWMRERKRLDCTLEPGLDSYAIGIILGPFVLPCKGWCMRFI